MRRFAAKLARLLFATGWIFIFPAFGSVQKAMAPIILHDEKLNFVPQEFYIAGVTDERDDHAALASLIIKDAVHSSLVMPADIQGGAAAGIKQFVDHNLSRNTALRPIIVSIKQFKLTESALPGGRVSGNLTMIFSFELQLTYSTVHLVDYSGGIRYNRPDNQSDAAEPVLRHGIENALAYFNKWINQQADINVLLAKGVKVNFSDYTEKPEGDTIYYAVNRPLTWNDFQDKPRESRFEAEVFAGIGYTEHTEVVKGIIHIGIAMKVDMPKSDCWAKPGNRNDYTLNHEQRHFDIAKLVSEHFKQKIMAMQLPVDNFDGPINVEYLETLREQTRLQKQYDSETRHGIDEQAQARWNGKIDRELKAYGVKK
jgi:hypothetical protein